MRGFSSFRHSIRTPRSIQHTIARVDEEEAAHLLGGNPPELLQEVRLGRSRNNVINSSVSEIMNFPVIEDRSTAIPSTRKFELEKLTREEIILVLNSLATLGSVDWKQGTESILVLHFSAFEFADEVYRWAKENYLIGDVETIDFISNGKSTGKHESK